MEDFHLQQHQSCVHRIVFVLCDLGAADDNIDDICLPVEIDYLRRTQTGCHQRTIIGRVHLQADLTILSFGLGNKFEIGVDRTRSGLSVLRMPLHRTAVYDKSCSNGMSSEEFPSSQHNILRESSSVRGVAERALSGADGWGGVGIGLIAAVALA
ncbi:hypothetical protein J6590_076962 [Homalodisca vitripennis]|nr:hypothetical protein J6590_076962 [Homalodisca vitripennis]